MKPSKISLLPVMSIHITTVNDPSVVINPVEESRELVQGQTADHCRLKVHYTPPFLPRHSTPLESVVVQPKHQPKITNGSKSWFVLEMVYL